MNTNEQKIKKQIEELRKKLPKKKRSKKKLPVFPTFEEYDKFITTLKKLKVNKEFLLCAILSYEAGLRISEIVGYRINKDADWIVPPLEVSNIDLKRNTIKIVAGKGGKDRVVPLPKSFNEKALKMIPLKRNRRTIQRFFDKYTLQILGKKLSIHKFRHGFGSRLAEQGVPLHQIQMWMGHSRLDTTGIYLHASPSQDNIDKVRELF